MLLGALKRNYARSIMLRLELGVRHRRDYRFVPGSPHRRCQLRDEIRAARGGLHWGVVSGGRRGAPAAEAGGRVLGPMDTISIRIVKRGNLMAANDQPGTSGPADSSGSFSFTTIARPAQKGLAFRSASSIVSSSDAVRMMRV